MYFESEYAFFISKVEFKAKSVFPREKRGHGIDWGGLELVETNYYI